MFALLTTSALGGDGGGAFWKEQSLHGPLVGTHLRKISSYTNFGPDCFFLTLSVCFAKVSHRKSVVFRFHVFTRLHETSDIPSGHIVRVPVLCVLAASCAIDLCDRFHGSSRKNVRVSCITESMSILTDPATCGILNNELTNCPRTGCSVATNDGDPSASRAGDRAEELVGQHATWRART